MGNVLFSESERRTYLQFVDELMSNIESRGCTSTFLARMQEAIPKLKEQASRASLDPSAVSWYTLAHVFIKGPIEASGGQIDLDALNQFIQFVECCNETKQEVVLNTILTRFNDVEMTYDDLSF